MAAFSNIYDLPPAILPEVLYSPPLPTLSGWQPTHCLSLSLWRQRWPVDDGGQCWSQLPSPPRPRSLFFFRGWQQHGHRFYIRFGLVTLLLVFVCVSLNWSTNGKLYIQDLYWFVCTYIYVRIMLTVWEPPNWEWMFVSPSANGKVLAADILRGRPHYKKDLRTGCLHLYS